MTAALKGLPSQGQHMKTRCLKWYALSHNGLFQGNHVPSSEGSEGWASRVHKAQRYVGNHLETSAIIYLM